MASLALGFVYRAKLLLTSDLLAITASRRQTGRHTLARRACTAARRKALHCQRKSRHVLILLDALLRLTEMEPLVLANTIIVLSAAIATLALIDLLMTDRQKDTLSNKFLHCGVGSMI